MALNRIYATSADLAEYLGTPAPDDADRLLARASEAIDDALLTAVYVVDVDGFPTNADQREALKLATCAVIEWWGADRGTGDETGAAGVWGSVSAGSVSLSRGTGKGSGSTQVTAGALPSRAYGYLRRAGLLTGTVYTW